MTGLSHSESRSGVLLPDCDIKGIKAILPHRYPMLMVDRVTQIRGNESAFGIKYVTQNEWFFQGHFPHEPVMPGVLIVEAMAQTAAVLIGASLGIKASDKLIYLMSVDQARFRAPVYPGSVLSLPVRSKQRRGKTWRFEGEGRVAETVCVSATFLATLVD